MGSARARLWKPQPLFFIPVHRRVETDDGEFTRHLQNGLDDRLAYLWTGNSLGLTFQGKLYHRYRGNKLHHSTINSPSTETTAASLRS
jgi:hypothetical protein